MTHRNRPDAVPGYRHDQMIVVNGHHSNKCRTRSRAGYLLVIPHRLLTDERDMIDAYCFEAAQDCDFIRSFVQRRISHESQKFADLSSHNRLKPAVIIARLNHHGRIMGEPNDDTGSKD